MPSPKLEPLNEQSSQGNFAGHRIHYSQFLPRLSSVTKLFPVTFAKDQNHTAQIP